MNNTFNHWKGHLIIVLLSRRREFVNFGMDYCIIYTDRLIIVFYFLEANSCIDPGKFYPGKGFPVKGLVL